MFTRQLLRRTTTSIRSYSTEASVSATPKKVGAFRGGFVGFLLGVTGTGIGCYYYLLDQYKSTNSVMISDIVSLQNSINNLEKHIKSLEEKK
ncbi:uncharacterized protein J8A68_002293 [[Candida] subhashii]|uniref:Uncharacterized protein n=1 Tax=[Candida] subhashii TaxID=561895 RepID=A0A8J5V179_9ASCO|nr:uncharacterized protein J8A68_002293 [[Candida] subhashii]KAG7664189.1 hypothetical protein J8A68_002293 [[Candida] subhashii]